MDRAFIQSILVLKIPFLVYLAESTHLDLSQQGSLELSSDLSRKCVLKHLTELGLDRGDMEMARGLTCSSPPYRQQSIGCTSRRRIGKKATPMATSSESSQPSTLSTDQHRQNVYLLLFLFYSEYSRQTLAYFYRGCGGKYNEGVMNIVFFQSSIYEAGEGVRSQGG